MIYKAKKSLGQNFLKSQKALADIVNAGDISPDDTILEIGPGKGALTEKLLEKAERVIAIEKDRELIELLKGKFSVDIKSGKLKLIWGDILEISNSDLEIATSYKLVANIPYYITGAIIRKFLEAKQQPERMVLLVQKEVAQRIVARDGKESILSISVKAYGEPVFIDTVKKRYFSPEPKVDSAILLIKNIQRTVLDKKGVDEARFFEIVKAGFAHKRKVLSSNLKPLSGPTTKWLEICKIPEKARAEDLLLENWVCLAKSFPLSGPTTK